MDKSEIKRKVLERIKSIDEWPKENQGTDRLALLQVAFNEGWFVDEFN